MTGVVELELCNERGQQHVDIAQAASHCGKQRSRGTNGQATVTTWEENIIHIFRFRPLQNEDSTASTMKNGKGAPVLQYKILVNDNLTKKKG